MASGRSVEEASREMASSREGTGEEIASQIPRFALVASGSWHPSFGSSRVRILPAPPPTDRDRDPRVTPQIPFQGLDQPSIVTQRRPLPAHRRLAYRSRKTLTQTGPRSREGTRSREGNIRSIRQDRLPETHGRSRDDAACCCTHPRVARDGAPSFTLGRRRFPRGSGLPAQHSRG